MPILFLGIELDATIKAELSQFLPARTRSLRPVASRLFHITLHYLGDVDEKDVLSVLDHGCRDIAFKPFELTINSLGYFGRRFQPAVLWAGLEGSSTLSDLHSNLRSLVLDCDVTPDTRDYHPHITLARGRWRKAADAREQQQLTSFYSQSVLPKVFTVSSFVVFESREVKGERRYEVIKRYSLTEF